MTMEAPSTTSTPSPKRYSPGIVILHWTIAILIFAAALLAMGQEGEGRRQAFTGIAGIPVIGVHMIIGITVLVLLLVRLAMRWRVKSPAWVSAGSPLLDTIGRLTHIGLYVFTLIVTITGLILALQTNRLARTFGLAGTQAGQFQPGQFGPRQFQPGQFPPPGGFQPGQERPGGFEGRFRGQFFLGAFHGLSWTILLLLIALHVGAALYHQFLRRDHLLGRMWFGAQA